jgi:hypothetical protein
MFGSFISRLIFANSAAAARIPSGFEFIRNEESRNAGEKPVHGFMGSLSKPSCGCLVPAGKATALPRRQGVEQKETKGTKKEIPGLGLLL